MELSHGSLKTTARLTGFLFIWLIITGLTGAMIVANVTGSGTLAEKSVRVVTSKNAYGLGLFFDLVETMSAMVLAFTLYIILRPFNQSLAQLGMYFRMGESIIGAVGVIFGFVKLHIYTDGKISAVNESSIQTLLGTIQHAGFVFYNTSAIFFSVGSLLFFYIFYKSKSIPRILSVIGLLASPIATALCIASLLRPEDARWLQLGWAPMAIAEVGTGIWLLVRGVKYNHYGSSTS